MPSLQTATNNKQRVISFSISQYAAKVSQRFYSRYPVSTRQSFNRRNLFIFPSPNGLWFLALDALLWLVGTNYENNLILMLAFLLTTLFITTILHTFANLTGLTIELMNVKPAFGGDDAEVTLRISKQGKRGRENVHLGWPRGNTVVVDLVDKDEALVTLFVPTQGRGWFNPGRLMIETFYPLGIMRCWSWPDLDCRILVYPRPISAGPLPATATAAEEGEQVLAHGADDFAGYRNYQLGDSLRDVAWKHYARGVGLYAKDYVAYADTRLWLEWDALPGMDREARLSRLCYWALQASSANKDYGVRLPGAEVQPSSGFHHKMEVLKTLALFEVETA